MTNFDQAPPNPFGRDVLNGPADYLPDWDVASIGKQATDALLSAIERASGSDRVDPLRKIHVLLGPPGYGKTHLFGRLAHALGDRVLFTFVPQIEDVRRPLSHIRHHVVMDVFDEAEGTRSRLATALASRCRPSFLSYLSILPRPLDAEYAPLRQRLQEDGKLDVVWDIVDRVKAVQPFLALGRSLARSLPALNGPVVRALSLGWSPEFDAARRWLRGESLPEELARRLELPDEPPAAVDVLKAVATLIGDRTPLVLCLDQLDVLLTDQENAPLQFSNDMMGLRAAIPNLLIVLSCLTVDWKHMSGKFNAAFKERTIEHDLDLLTAEQATELVRRRLKFWPGGPPERGEWWPIDEAFFRRLLDEPQRPRGLLKTCETAYQEWADEGDPGRLIELGKRNGPHDPPALFLQEWEKELGAVGSDKARSLEHVQDQRLARALKEGLGLLQEMPHGVHKGIIPEAVREDPVPQVAGNPDPYRYTFEVVLGGRKGAEPIITALEVNHSNRKFSPYYSAVMSIVEEKAVGAVFLTTKPQLPAGAETRRNMEGQMRKGRLRTITLTDYQSDFDRLECYLTLLDRASNQNLQLGARTIPVGECRKLAAKAGLLANLGLFDQLLDGWVLPPSEAAGVAAQGAAAPTGDASPTPEAEVKPAEEHARPAEGTDEGPPSGSEAGAGPESEAGPHGGPQGSTLEERVEWAMKGQELIIKRLGELGARVRSKGVTQIGPTFARFLVTPYPATTIGKIRNRAEDLKVALVVDSLPLISSQAGAICIDVQLPDRFRRAIPLGSVGPAPAEMGGAAPSFPVGQDVAGVTHWLNFADPNTCHLLVAGTTGSGKSEFLKSLIAALARRLGPRLVRFALIDPKQVTFNLGERPGPFLLRPVAHGSEDALTIVKECFEETERRYAELRSRKLEDLAQWQAAEPTLAPPRIIVVFDEFADLMADKEAKKALEAPLKRLGAKARAAGIHLVLATQRPEASVVTPLLRSNLPARVCLRVASPADSNIILKKPDGADLLGRGDLLWQRGAGLVRLQSPFVDRGELEAILFPR